MECTDKKYKPWDGKDPSGRYTYDKHEIEFWQMEIDEAGTVYYHSLEEGRPRQIWCPAGQLTRHLYHLEQIKAR